MPESNVPLKDLENFKEFAEREGIKS